MKIIPRDLEIKVLEFLSFKRNIIHIYFLALAAEQAKSNSTPVEHGRRSLIGCSPWGREESDMTE